MNVESVLLSEKNIIECTACGKCCPSICPAKRNNLCEVHPSVKGTETRDYVCTISPVDIYFMGVDCPPVADRVEQLTGERLEPVNYFCGVPQLESDKLHTLLQIEIVNQ